MLKDIASFCIYSYKYKRLSLLLIYAIKDTNARTAWDTKHGIKNITAIQERKYRIGLLDLPGTDHFLRLFAGDRLPCLFKIQRFITRMPPGGRCTYYGLI